MKRRDFLGMLGAAAALPARAQQPERMRRIGVLMSFTGWNVYKEARDRAVRSRRHLRPLRAHEGRARGERRPAAFARRAIRHAPGICGEGQGSRRRAGPAKAASNLRKHRVSFEAARLVFDDPMALDEPDLIIIGRAGAALLTLAYAERGERFRIISARDATRQEHDEYNQGQ